MISVLRSKPDYLKCVINCSLTAEQDSLAWQSAHFQIIKSLKSRNDEYIIKPDNGPGVVILRLFG